LDTKYHCQKGGWFIRRENKYWMSFHPGDLDHLLPH
jgi:hypothetical protein